MCRMASARQSTSGCWACSWRHCRFRHFTAGLEVTRYLLSLGHTRIGALSGPAKYKSLVDRLCGHTIALLQQGLSPHPDLQPRPTPGHPRNGYV
jgi:DNA-binding LacI/PurR family transcriptional regulator